MRVDQRTEDETRRTTISSPPQEGVQQPIDVSSSIGTLLKDDDDGSPSAAAAATTTSTVHRTWNTARRILPSIPIAVVLVLWGACLILLPTLTTGFISTTTPLTRIRLHQRIHSKKRQQQQQHLPTIFPIPHTSSSFSSGLSLSSHSSDDAAAAATTPSAVSLATIVDDDQHVYRTAIQNTLLWVGAAVLFGGVLGITQGPELASEFFAGYLVEQSLSVDNLFVFLLLFDYFQVPLAYQGRALYWGITGAVLMRAVMIGLGAVALSQFRPILLVFAGILVYSSARFFLGNDGDEQDDDPSNNSIVRFSKSLLPSTNTFDGDRFFTMEDGIRKATPLFICMVALEVSDIVFAVDSIPAVFGVTENPLVVFSSNMFAILGLRSLYTILSKAAADLVYLEPAVAMVLGFIGSKMIAEYFDILIPTNIALVVVATLLGSGIGLSVLEKREKQQDDDDDDDDNDDKIPTL